MMTKEQRLSHVSKAIDVMDELGPEFHVSLDVFRDSVRLHVFPVSFIPMTDEQRKKCLSLTTPLVGYLEKSESGGETSMHGTKDGLTIHLGYVAVCKIVGYIEKQEPEMILSGRTVTKSIRVTDCDIKQGRYKFEDVKTLESN